MTSVTFSVLLWLWPALRSYATNYLFQLALNTHESNYIYFTLKQKFSWHENFAVLSLTLKNSKLSMWKNFPNQILKFCIFFDIILQFVHCCHKLLLSLNLIYPRVKLLQFLKKKKKFARHENFAVSLLTFETSKKFQQQTLKCCNFLDMFLQLVHQMCINKSTKNLRTFGKKSA